MSSIEVGICLFSFKTKPTGIENVHRLHYLRKKFTSFTKIILKKMPIRGYLTETLNLFINLIVFKTTEIICWRVRFIWREFHQFLLFYESILFQTNYLHMIKM